MAIINHQLCYFLSGDYLGEEGEVRSGGKGSGDRESSTQGEVCSWKDAITAQNIVSLFSRGGARHKHNQQVGVK